MNASRTTVLALLASLVACGPLPGPGADQPITRDDVVNVSDLVIEDDDASGALQIGDPARLLADAQGQARDTTTNIRSVLGMLQDIVSSREPDVTGQHADGRAFAVWDGTVEGKQVRFVVGRMSQTRVRYLLAAREGTNPWKGLLTGIFVKHAPRVGGGRLHLSLTNVSDLFGAPNADGSVHLVFATHRSEAKGRRILYLNVKDRAVPDAVPASYGQDIIHFPGVGGRFRAVAVGDLLPGDQPPLAGTELAAIRVLWRHGLGGRADAAIAHFQPEPSYLLGTAHECWNAQGLRTAYADSVAENDAEEPNEGDVASADSCGGFGREDVPEDVVAGANAHDADPELDALLEEAGADQIDETEADSMEDPDAAA